ncbi:hypothetical protein ACH4MJ_15225 [Streptomyces anulatus]
MLQTSRSADGHVACGAAKALSILAAKSPGKKVSSSRSTCGACTVTSPSGRYPRPDVHKITAAGAALSAHFNVLRAPRSLPSPIVMTR